MPRLRVLALLAPLLLLAHGAQAADPRACGRGGRGRLCFPTGSSRARKRAPRSQHPPPRPTRRSARAAQLPAKPHAVDGGAGGGQGAAREPRGGACSARGGVHACGSGTTPTPRPRTLPPQANITATVKAAIQAANLTNQIDAALQRTTSLRPLKCANGKVGCWRARARACARPRPLSHHTLQPRRRRSRW